MPPRGHPHPGWPGRALTLPLRAHFNSVSVQTLRHCALCIFCFFPYLGPHSLVWTRARAVLTEGWGGTGMATVPPQRTAALAAAFGDVALHRAKRANIVVLVFAAHTHRRYAFSGITSTFCTCAAAGGGLQSAGCRAIPVPFCHDV